MHSDPSPPLDRFSRLAGRVALFSLALCSVLDRSTTRMAAVPWVFFYWLSALIPLALLAHQTWSHPTRCRGLARGWLTWVGLSVAALLIGALASPYRAYCLPWLMTPLAGLATFLLLHDWLRSDPTHRARLLRSGALGAGLLLGASVLYWMIDIGGLSRSELFSRVFFDLRNPHPLGHSNYTAGLALLALSWFLMLRRECPDWARRATAAGLGLALLVLFTSGSRGGVLGLGALGLGWLVAARWPLRVKLKWASLALLATLALAFTHPRLRAIFEPRDANAPPNISNVQRLAMAEAGIHMGLERPLTGWGLHTTPLVYPRFRAQVEGGAENVLQLHNLPLELWAGLGAPGLLALLGFVGLVFRHAARAPLAASGLFAYGVFALTDYQLDVPIITLALAALTALVVSAAPELPARPAARRALASGFLLAAALVATLGRQDPTPALNTTALTLARDPARHEEAIAQLRTSLALNPDQEIAHFNLGWLLLVRDPAAAETHFLRALRLVPDKGGAYFGLGLARLNQGRAEAADHAFALECLNDPRFLASPWWREPALAARRETTAAAYARLLQRVEGMRLNEGWPARQAAALLPLAARLGQPSPGSELTYRRERTGYPVLMRQPDLAPPTDLYDVREDPRFPASVNFTLPPKGWLPTATLRYLLDHPVEETF